MPVKNLSEDWNRLFGARNKPPTPPPSPKKKVIVEEEIDLVVDKKPAKRQPTPEDWKTSAEVYEDPEPNITIKTRVNRKTQPVISGNKTYVSNNTALWAQVRKNLYPMYAKFCADNGYNPSIVDFTKIISGTWKTLSQEDKAKAAANPSDYFTF